MPHLLSKIESDKQLVLLFCAGGGEGPARPMTGIRGAGYPGTAAGARGPAAVMFDPMNQARQTSASAGLERQLEETPEDKIKGMERKVIHSMKNILYPSKIFVAYQVTDLIEESCLAASRGEARTALDRAKEASAKERSLIRLLLHSGINIFTTHQIFSPVQTAGPGGTERVPQPGPDLQRAVQPGQPVRLQRDVHRGPQHLRGQSQQILVN